MVAASLSLCGLSTVVARPEVAQAAEPGPTKVLLLLDVSGSMNEKISSGGTKFSAAKSALKEVVGALPDGTQVGLRVYGSKISEPQERNPKACTDSQLVLPVGPLNKSAMNKAVDSFSAKGETPIAYSLGKAVDDLGDSGKRVLVLISDGQESCAGDPCPVARKLAKSGIDLQFNAIGLAVDGKARKQLQCIADAGNGSYYDASRASDLADAIRRITSRALRPFQFNGTPVQGNTDSASAPQIGAGLYTDIYDTSDTPRYYQVTHTPGSTLTASIASIVNPYPAQNQDFWKMGLATPDGAKCGSYNASAPSYHGITVVSGAVRSAAAGQGSTGADDACANEPTLILSLSRQSSFAEKKQAPVEIQITEEQAITNLASLPEPVTGYDGKGKKLPLGATKKVLGGVSFSNAEAITPGSWTDSMATGETVFYKVRLETGQRLRTTLYAPAPKSSWSMTNLDALTAQVDVYAPSRIKLTHQYAAMQGSRKVTFTATSPEVRVRNREHAWPTSYADDANSLSAASEAGDYYIAVALDPLARDFAGRVMSIRLEVAVDGQPAGQPEYGTVSVPPSASATPAGSASDTPGASAPASPADDEPDSSGVPLGAAIGIGLLAAAAVVGGAIVIGRRRGRRP